MTEITPPCKLKHKMLGTCTLVRVEGVVWVVAFGKNEFRFLPSQRSNFTVIADAGDVSSQSPTAAQTIPRDTTQLTSIPTSASSDLVKTPIRSGSAGILGKVTKPANAIEREQRSLRMAVRSIATGLSPQNAKLTRSLAIGLDACFHQIDNFLDKTRERGAALVVRGAYGCGKTLTLYSTHASALERNFVFAQTEIDASEVRLDQAPTVYSTIMRGLKFPDGGEGLDHLLELYINWLSSSRAPAEPRKLFDWLLRRVQCGPLAWILSDRRIRENRALIDALGGISLSIDSLRRRHPLPNHQPRWPYFKYGTQGDVGSYLISGIARLIKELGFDGLVLALDEMEKWQDLDWRNQERASNLLGGLIWSATANPGMRDCKRSSFHWSCTHPSAISHSAFNGGCQFSTSDPCNLGIIIAMTPRGINAPEESWRTYGELSIIDLPQYTLDSIRDHFEKVASLYERAYGVEVPIACRDVAEGYWRKSNDHSARSGAIALTTAIDEWRGQ